MFEKADAHAHLFSPGYVDVLPESCRQEKPDEVTLYEALRKRANITALLAIGYEGDPFARGNNEYVLDLAEERDWIHPVMFVTDLAGLSVAMLEQWGRRRAAGLSLYLTDAAKAATLAQVKPAVWEWIEKNRWVISVNSIGEHWAVWEAVLGRHAPRMIMSHLGLPEARQSDSPGIAELPGEVLALAQYKSVGIKASAFYALTHPSYGYPHRAAWGYVESAIKAFGIDRVYWGSDFSPSLEHVSFPQTYALFDKMPFLSADDRRKILGGNLLKLLGEVTTRAKR